MHAIQTCQKRPHTPPVRESKKTVDYSRLLGQLAETTELQQEKIINGLSFRKFSRLLDCASLDPIKMQLFWNVESLSANKKEELSCYPRSAIEVNVLAREQFRNFLRWIANLEESENNLGRLSLFNHEAVVNFSRPGQIRYCDSALELPFPQMPDDSRAGFARIVEVFGSKMRALGETVEANEWKIEFHILRYPIEGKYIAKWGFHHDISNGLFPRYTLIYLLSDSEDETSGWEGGKLILRKHQRKNTDLPKEPCSCEVQYCYRQNEAIVFDNDVNCHGFTSQYARGIRATRDLMIVWAFPIEKKQADCQIM